MGEEVTVEVGEGEGVGGGGVTQPDKIRITAKSTTSFHFFKIAIPITTFMHDFDVIYTYPFQV
ncbi:MAG: hypothetical protein OIN85_01370 [Candidatus Methanoperedens sp.]|nr:hypothetical protein [Candidatus Methanoperedens sp.]